MSSSRVGAMSALVSCAVMAACSGAAGERSKNKSRLHVTAVGPAEYRGAGDDPLEAACGNWTLSPLQVHTFFRLAEAYEDRPYGHFYQVDCSISGELQADGNEWRFVINGGGIATWQDGDTVRHFGCSAKGCEPLLLLPSDGMEPD